MLCYFSKKISLFFLLFFIFLSFFKFGLTDAQTVSCTNTNQTCRSFDPYTGNCAINETKIGLCSDGKNCCEKVATVACNANNQTCRAKSQYGASCLPTTEKNIGLCSDGKDCCEKVAAVTCTGTGETCRGSGTYGSCLSGETSVGPCSDGTTCCKSANSTSTSSTSSTSASFTYTPLEEIPGQGITTDLSSYIKGLYSFAIFSIGIAALLMVVIGGFIYVTAAGNTSNVDKGKGYIRDALIGILIAFGSYLILYVINPNLVNIDLSSLSKLSLSGGVGSTGSTGSTGTGTGGSGSATSNPGTCGGIKIQSGTAGCSLASGELGGMLSCMVGKGINNYSGHVYSVTSNATGDNKEASAACCGNGHTSNCPHSNTTCHHGCTMSDKGNSYSVDYLTTSLSDTQICEVVDIAIACGATSSGNIWGPKNMCNGKVRYASGHSNHLHIPTSSCGH